MRVRGLRHMDVRQTQLWSRAAFVPVNPDEGYRRSHFAPPQPDQPSRSVGDYCAAVLNLR